jgi:hypothetical protein
VLSGACGRERAGSQLVPGTAGARVRRLDAERGEVAEHGSGACEAAGLAPWTCWAAPPAGLIGVRADLAWLGRAEQPGQDAGDDIWVAVREFLGGR